MDYFPVKFEARDPKYREHNGHMALTLGWSYEMSEPVTSRYVIITPWMADEYPEWIRDTYPYYSSNVVGNRIYFNYPRQLCFVTDDMPKFTERIDVPMPRRPWKFNRRTYKYERKKYEWSFGKWVCIGWEEREEEEEEDA